MGSANNDEAAYLKNRVENDLSLNGAASGMATPVFVSGSDLYLSDNTSQGAVDWKKGVETNLLSTGNANSMFCPVKRTSTRFIPINTNYFLPG